MRRHAFVIGDVIEVQSDIDLGPHGVIARGEGGLVVAHDIPSGEVWIRLTTPHKGLSEYANEMWLTPPYSDGIEAALTCTSPCVQIIQSGSLRVCLVATQEEIIRKT